MMFKCFSFDISVNFINKVTELYKTIQILLLETY